MGWGGEGDTGPSPPAGNTNFGENGGFSIPGDDANPDPHGGPSSVNAADPTNPRTGFEAGGQGFWSTIDEPGKAAAPIADPTGLGPAKGVWAALTKEKIDFNSCLFARNLVKNTGIPLTEAGLVFTPLAAKAAAMAGPILGPVAAELAKATLANITESLNEKDGSLCLPTDIAGKLAGGGLAIAKGKAGMSVSEVASDPLLSGYMEKGTTVATSISSTSMDAIAGINMASSFINGKPLGGSTAETLKKLVAPLGIGSAGGAVGQIPLSLLAAGVGAVTPVFNALTFVANSYSSGGIPLTGDTIIPAANPYASLGILDAEGNIAPVFAEQLPETANTNKANPDPGFTFADAAGNWGGLGVDAQGAAIAADTGFQAPEE